MSHDDFTRGDTVTWKSRGQNVKGMVEEKITSGTGTARRKVRASKEQPKSKSVGQKGGRAESTGHAAGWRIVAILRAKRADLSDDDYAHMRKVVGYAKRHLKQRPSGDISDTKWRYSLMNWGHDPNK